MTFGHVLAPEKKPKKIANKAVPAVSFTAIMHRVTIPDPIVKKMVKLKTPSLGANKLGSVRPNILAALRMDSWIMRKEIISVIRLWELIADAIPYQVECECIIDMV